MQFVAAKKAINAKQLAFIYGNVNHQPQTAYTAYLLNIHIVSIIKSDGDRFVLFSNISSKKLTFGY